MSEDWMLALMGIEDYLKRIADALEKLVEQKSENQQPLTIQEEVIQDFTGVTIMQETPKAYLVVKNGFQMWVAKSNLQEEYELGTLQDLLLTEKAEKWLPKKSWDKFTPQKRGKN